MSKVEAFRERSDFLWRTPLPNHELKGLAFEEMFYV